MNPTRVTIRRRVPGGPLLVVGLLVLLAGEAASQNAGPALRSESLARQQELQRQAREQARGVLTRVLDLQLQSLEENQLTHLPIYGEIELFRRHLDALVEGEMQEVIDLLSRAEGGSAAEIERALVEARRLTRDIVGRLGSERKQLLLRFQATELGLHWKRLIDRQTRVLKETRGLPTLSAQAQETALITTLQGQRDVGTMFERLTVALKQAAQLEGEPGTRATGALRALESAEAPRLLEQAAQTLEQLDHATAVKRQEAILAALREARQQFAAAGTADPGATQDRGDLERLMSRQEAIREETGRAKLDGADADALVAKENGVRQQIEELARRLESTPELRDSLELARQAAANAAARLFEGQKPQALAEQNQVLEHLSQAAQQLAPAAADEATPASAAELADRQKQLEALREELEKIQAQQNEASRQAAESPKEGARLETDVAAALGQLDSAATLPKSVAASLQEARQAAQQAAEALRATDEERPDQPPASRAVDQADREVERAVAEAQLALDDARRGSLAAQLEELNQSAGELEQAAAAERAVVQATQEAEQEEGLAPEEASELAREQARIGEQAAQAAQALEQSVPEAAAQARQAQAAAEESRQALEQSTPSDPQSAQTAGRQAQEAAESLAQAAAKVREQASKTARELSQESERQRSRAAALRQAIERAAEQEDSSLPGMMQRLLEARQAAQSGLIDQHLATGHPEAALARQMSDRIRKAADHQIVAEQAARRAEQLPPDSPAAVGMRNAALTAQESAVRETRRAAESLRDLVQTARQEKQPGAEQGARIVAELDEAAAAAASAAQAMQEGKPSASGSSRAAAHAALRRVEAELEELAATSAKAPSRSPDAAAQQRVADSAQAGKDVLDGDFSDLDQLFGRAARNALRAAELMETGQTPQAAASQAQADQSLVKAKLEIQKKLTELERQQAHALAGMAQRAGDLAQEAASVDPEALEALRDAQAAAEGTQMPGEDAQAATQLGARQQSRAQSQKAASRLAQREQQLAREQADASAAPQSGDSEQPGETQGSQGRGDMGTGGQSDAGQPDQTEVSQSGRDGKGSGEGNAQSGEGQGQGGNSSGSGEQGTGGGPSGAAAGAESDPAARPPRQEPWLIRLPPELRKEIRARSQRPPPRRYEQRLQRYFERLE
ncbi:MAG: hypothetical protein ACKV0T_22985 [Planctomycetales bacterium]